MILLLDAIADALECGWNGVGIRLNHPLEREKINRMFNYSKLRTLYNDRNGFKRTFFFGGISKQSAAELYAYGNLGKIWNVTVPQHMYARHRIRIKHPHLPCVIEKQFYRRRGTKNLRYYPLELLELVKEDMEEPDTFEIEEEKSEINDTLGKIGSKMLKEMAKNLFKELPIKEDDNDSADGDKEDDEHDWSPSPSFLPPLSLRSFIEDDDDEEEFGPSTSRPNMDISSE